MRTSEKRIEKENTFRRHRGLAVRGTILLVLVLALLLLRPWYLQYREEKSRAICLDVRDYMIWDYLDTREAALNDESALLDLAEKSIASSIQSQTGCQISREDDAILITDLCRSGGTVRVTVADPATGQLSISCDAEGHEAYLSK